MSKITASTPRREDNHERCGNTENNPSGVSIGERMAMASSSSLPTCICSSQIPLQPMLASRHSHVRTLTAPENRCPVESTRHDHVPAFPSWQPNALGTSRLSASFPRSLRSIGQLSEGKKQLCTQFWQGKASSAT